jgi:hypothetical protein
MQACCEGREQTVATHDVPSTTTDQLPLLVNDVSRTASVKEKSWALRQANAQRGLPRSSMHSAELSRTECSHLYQVAAAYTIRIYYQVGCYDGFDGAVAVAHRWWTSSCVRA